MEVRTATWSKPLPALDALSRDFWSAAAEGRLLVQHCSACGLYQHYPRRLCLGCGADPHWEEASGLGTVHTHTVIRQNGASGFRDETPYVVAMIELEEGARMMGNVTGCPVEEVFVGMPVRAYAIAAEEGLGIVQWEPALP
jgi:uncharacterized OB-fold protein